LAAKIFSHEVLGCKEKASPEIWSQGLSVTVHAGAVIFRTTMIHGLLFEAHDDKQLGNREVLN